MNIGAHMSIAKGILQACMSAVNHYGATAMQCFLKSPRGGKEPSFTDAQCQQVADYCQREKLFTIVHCSYLLNFAKDLSGGQKYQLESLINDCNNAARMGMHGVVFHIGKKLELPYETAVQYIVDNLIVACAATNIHGPSGQKPRILLETTAGQGSEVGWNLEELANIFHRLATHHNRIGICVDTAHIWAGGHDISTQELVTNYFEQFNQIIGLKHLDCIHLNDSLKPCGSRVDRHMDIGRGQIGTEGLKAIVHFANKQNIPCILETPQKEQSWVDEINLVKQWVKR